MNLQIVAVNDIEFCQCSHTVGQVTWRQKQHLAVFQKSKIFTCWRRDLIWSH